MYATVYLQVRGRVERKIVESIDRSYPPSLAGVIPSIARAAGRSRGAHVHPRP
eukprot:COSAG02_NODE_3853_length_6144_cov_137.748056_6_plen_53_part_00